MDFKRADGRNIKKIRNRKIMQKTKKIKHSSSKKTTNGFSEKDIRPASLMTREFKLFERDIKGLLKYKKDFVNIPCPACGKSSHKVLFKKEHFNFVQCIQCKTIFINPRPSSKILSDFYTKSESIKYWNEKIFPASEDVRRHQIFIPRVERVIELCKKYNIPAKTLLDVGAGFGTFCQEFEKSDFFGKVLALEPSPGLAKTCRNKGLNTIEKSVEDLKPDEIGEVNVITAFELIEHLFCPENFLSSCAKLLCKRGILIITTPNIKGFDLLVLEKLSDNIRGPNHLNYFHPESLKTLLRRSGFETVNVQTPGKLDAAIVRKKILNGELKVFNQPFLKEVLIEQWEKLGSVFQQFLSDNTLSSHLWIVARKM